MNLTVNAYLKAFSRYPSHKGITGGTIHQFLTESRVNYYSGPCPVYYVEHYHNGQRAIIGGNYVTNGKPKLVPNESVDFE